VEDASHNGDYGSSDALKNLSGNAITKLATYVSDGIVVASRDQNRRALFLESRL